MGCAFLRGQAAALPVLECLGNREPLAEDGPVLTPRNPGLLGCVQARGHDCRGPSSPLPFSSSGCSVGGAPRLMREDAACTFLFLRPRVLLHVHIAYCLREVQEGRFNPLLSVSQAPTSPLRPSQTTVSCVSSETLCAWLRTHTHMRTSCLWVSPRLHG